MPRPRMDNSQLWERYRATRSLDDRNALAVAYLPLVERIAEKLHRSLPRQTVFDVEALVNAGVPGLLSAIERFDPARGFYFRTYATLPVQGAMLDELRRHDWVPRLERARHRQGLIDAPRSCVPFRLEVNAEGEEAAYGQTFADARPGPEHGQAIEDFWREHLRGLSQTERWIVLLYFREGLRMSQVGAQLGLSESRVSQMTSALLRRLRSANEPVPPTRIPRMSRPKRASPVKHAVLLPRETISTKVFDEEKQRLQAAARASGLSLSAWMRVELLKAVPHSA